MDRGTAIDTPNRAQRTMRAVARALFGVNWGVPGVDNWDFAQMWKRATDLVRTPDTLDMPYSQVGPYQRCVSVISRDAAAIPWEFFQVDSNGEPSDKPVKGHPVSKLLARPNGYMLGTQLLVGSYISAFVFGEWIWWYPDLRVGKPGGLKATQGARGEIFLLYPPRVKRKMNDKGGIEYALIRDGMEDMPLDGKVVTHYRRYNPYDQVSGLPLAASIMADLLGYHAAAAWNSRFFNEQNGVPTAVLIPVDGTYGQADDRKKFLRTWKHEHARRTVGMLPGGWDIKDLGISQRDMDFHELRQFGRDEILAAAGVPPLIAGYLTRPITYNASEQKELYWESTIHSFVDEQQAVLNSDFLPKIGVEERAYPKWEIVAAMLENLLEKTDIAVKWFDLGLSKRVINERLEMGWDPLLIEDYEVGYTTFNRVPVGSELLLRAPATDTRQGDEDEDEDGETEEERRLKRSVAGRDELRRTLFWRALTRHVLDLEHRMNGVVRRHFHEIREEVLRNLGGVRGWRATHQREPAAQATVTLLFDLTAANEKLKKATKPVHAEALKRGGDTIMAEVGLGVSFDVQDPVVLVRLERLQGKIVGINETVETNLRAQLAEGLSLGESPQQLAARVRQTMDASMSRSMTIARTETGFAFSDGRDAGMRQAGIGKKEWLTARDASVRDSHQIDGEVRGIDEPFSNGMQRPLDPGAPAEEVINCRCTEVPVLEEAS